MDFVILNAVSLDHDGGAIASRALKRQIEGRLQRCRIVVGGPGDKPLSDVPDAVVIVADRPIAGSSGASGSLLKDVPVALMMLGDAAEPAQYDLLRSLVELQAVCFPTVAQVSASDDDRTRLCAASIEHIRQFYPKFAAFAAAMKLYRNLCEPSRTENRGEIGHHRINHLNIMTTDLDGSVAFYQRTLGARRLYNLGPDKVVTDINGFEFFIERVETVRYPPGFHVGIRTAPDQVQALHDKLRRDGVRLVNGNNFQPGVQLGLDGVRSAFYFEDPDGLLIEVYSPELESIPQSPALATY